MTGTLSKAAARPQDRPGAVRDLPGDRLLDDYFAVRRRAKASPPPDSRTLMAVHRFTESWLRERFDLSTVDYCTFDRPAVETKLLSLAAAIDEQFPGLITEDELRTTQLFVEQAFTLYEEALDGSPRHVRQASELFAFVVPSRNSRLRPDYGAESEMNIPVTRYAPRSVRGFMTVGLPPLVIDRFDGFRGMGLGYLVHAPIYPDSMQDMPWQQAADLARTSTRQAVEFASRRFGATVIGLGAVIPAITKFGESLSDLDVVTTTGHAGTVAVVTRTIERSIDHGLVDRDGPLRLGFLGLGSIGRSAAQVIASKFGAARVSIFDARPAAVERAAADLRSMGVDAYRAADVLDLTRASNVLVSAITGEVDLHELDPAGALDLSAKVIIDDSQPASFERRQVEQRGGTLVWVIAHDTRGVVRRLDYDYASMADAHSDLFGCEAEAASLAHYYRELLTRGLGERATRRIIQRVAVREPVTPARVRLFSALFKKFGIVAAPFQVNGEYVAVRDLE